MNVPEVTLGSVYVDGVVDRLEVLVTAPTMRATADLHSRLVNLADELDASYTVKPGQLTMHNGATFHFQTARTAGRWARGRTLDLVASTYPLKQPQLSELVPALLQSKHPSRIVRIA